MARNNMEKEFSEKLQEREIMPSNAAWDRLDAMLTATESAKPKKSNRRWLMIAASITAFLMISSLFFFELGQMNPDEPTVENGQSVAETENTEKEDSVTVQNPMPVQKMELADNEGSVERTSGKPSVKQKRNSGSSDKIEKNEEIHPTDNIEKQEKQMLLAEENSEALLNAIKSKIDSREKPGIKVDAKNLLENVDEEPIQLSARQKLMRSLNRNIQHVKVAVENRNVEENQ